MTESGPYLRKPVFDYRLARKLDSLAPDLLTGSAYLVTK